MSEENDMTTDVRWKWQHRDGDEYVVITAQAVGDPEQGYRIAHHSDLDRSPIHSGAVRRGFQTVECDDFNIGVLRDGVLTAILWMDEIVDDDPTFIAEVAEEIDLT